VPPTEKVSVPPLLDDVEPEELEDDVDPEEDVELEDDVVLPEELSSPPHAVKQTAPVVTNSVRALRKVMPRSVHWPFGKCEIPAPPTISAPRQTRHFGPSALSRHFGIQALRA
jgi:hypothetical protein